MRVPPFSRRRRRYRICGKVGRIITIALCLAEHAPHPNFTVYSMSKSTLLAFTRGSLENSAPRDITVNLGHPNRRLTALGRYGKRVNIAATVAHLASPAADFLTGSAVTVGVGFA